MLDLFCGRFGWSRAFAARGWTCVGVDIDLTEKPPDGVSLMLADVRTLDVRFVSRFDFVCASSPCEQFSVHGMKHFHKDPPYPQTGLELFEHTRQLCEAAGVPYVMENVRAAQKFVGSAMNRMGPFYMWGNAVPFMLPQSQLPITKGIKLGNSSAVKNMTLEERRAYRKKHSIYNADGSKSEKRRRKVAAAATIPQLLADAVAAHAEKVVEWRRR